MNLGKAKEYFSSYYEGSLDKGLKQTFELHLREDAQLKAEYRAFERTMADLQDLGKIEIEPPADLHDKIAARIDRLVWEQERQKTPFLASWWKLITVGAVGAAAIVIGVFQVQGHNRQVAPAGITPGPQVTHVQFKAEGKSVEVSYPMVSSQEIRVTDSQGHIVQDISLRNQGLTDKELVNFSKKAKLLSLDVVDSGATPSLIALPGRDTDSTKAGKGTLRDLALALADHYGEPVILQVSDASKLVSWTFDSSDPLEAAHTAINSYDLAVELQSGDIVIQDH